MIVLYFHLSQWISTIFMHNKLIIISIYIIILPDSIIIFNNAEFFFNICLQSLAAKFGLWCSQDFCFMSKSLAFCLLLDYNWLYLANLDLFCFLKSRLKVCFWKINCFDAIRWWYSISQTFSFWSLLKSI